MNPHLSHHTSCGWCGRSLRPLFTHIRLAACSTCAAIFAGSTPYARGARPAAALSGGATRRPR